MAKKLNLWVLEPDSNNRTRVEWMVHNGERLVMHAELQKHGRKWQFIACFWIGKIQLAYSSPPSYNSKRNAHAGLVNWLEPLVDLVVGHVLGSRGANWRFCVPWGPEFSQQYVSPYAYDDESSAEGGAETFIAHLRDLARRIREDK